MRNVFTIIDELSARLQELKAALQPLAAFASGARHQQPTRRTWRRRQRGRMTAGRTATSRRASLKRPAAPKRPVSPKVRALRAQQGKYLAALRNLTIQQRAQVKRAKANGDYASALKLAASLRKKSA